VDTTETSFWYRKWGRRKPQLEASSIRGKNIWHGDKENLPDGRIERENRILEVPCQKDEHTSHI